jgi:glycosyltransferase involved in cell wall biosynthesis
MKNVLFINKVLPQYRVDFFNQLKSELIRHDVELHLIYGKANKTDALKKDEVEIKWAQCIPNRRLRFGKSEILWQPYIKYLNDKDLILVQTENKLFLNYYLILARHFTKSKLGFWGPAKNMREENDTWPNRFRFLFLKKCDWWFGYTTGVKKFLMERNFPEERITVVQNAIDTHKLRKDYFEVTEMEISELKSQLGIKGNNTALFCGSMYKGKSLDFILEACHKIKKDIPDFNMIFVGSGVEAVKAFEASKKFSWIHYVGTRFGRERVMFFKISAVQLMPRLVGLAILDSFAMETPIITTSNPFHGAEIDYLENGINGIMTEDDVNEYSNVVIQLLKTERYRELLPGCKTSAEKYTTEAMVENFKNGILSALNI